MEKETLKSIQLVCSLLLGDRNAAVTPYKPSKTEIPKKSNIYFKRSKPEAHRMSSERIIDFLSELETNRRCNIHSVMVLKDGEVITEAYAPGFERGLPHLSHSMSKTVTGIAVAILADEEKICADTTVAEIFTEYKFPRTLGSVSVRELINMSAGLSFSETGAVASENWTEDFFNSDERFEHGEGFLYNSMNSYILARAVEKLSGESFGSFVHTRLFEPLYIENYFWEKGPEGTEKGGWGLYMSLEDWLKIATLFINGGKFEDKTIVSHVSILELLLTRNEHSSGDDRDFDYGGHVKMMRDGTALLLSGLFGQSVYVDPSKKLAVAINAGNGDVFRSGETIQLILKYFASGVDEVKGSLRSKWKAARVLGKMQRDFFSTRTFVQRKKTKSFWSIFSRSRSNHSREWEALYGTYLLPNNNASVLPVVQRIVENNLQGGIDSIRITPTASAISFKFTMQEQSCVITAGREGAVENVLEYYGEKYLVRAICGTSRIDGEVIYKLELIFPELPNSRKITIRKSAEDIIELFFEESPDAQTFIPFIRRLRDESNLVKIAFEMIERKLGRGFVERKVHELFTPSFIAPRADSVLAKTILEAENSRIEKERKEILSVPFISAFVKKSIDDGESPDPLPTKKRGFLGFLSGLFSSHKRDGEA